MLRRNFTFHDMNKLFETLKTFNKSDEKEGITRLAYSPEDEAVHGFILESLAENGLVVRQDAVGNIFARLPGADRGLPAVGTGSHLDTVPQGGAYDGALGVVAGFYALMQFKPAELLRDLELVIFRGEESSRFGFSCAGSKILSGKADAGKWSENRDGSGKTIFQAIDDAGYCSKEMAQCALPAHYFSAFVELHIEQGKRLETSGLTIGVVNGIAAPTRFAVVVKGHADHSGATPMNQRQDALVASAAIIDDLNRAGCRESAWGTVATVGKIEVHPNSMNVIPGEVTLYVDIRGIEEASIRRVASRLKETAHKAETDNEVKIIVREISSEQPVKLDEEICNVISQQCEKMSIDHMVMLSGAGHDTMNIASKYPAAMIFAPSRKGISHHPDEFTAFADIERATEVLKETLAVLANRQ